MRWKGDGVVVGEARKYPEWTVRITIFAIVLGILGTVASVYSGLKIANVLSMGAVAVTLGMVFKAKAFGGTILEVNMGQMMASSVNVCAAGVIFTIPALFIMYTYDEVVGMPGFNLTNLILATTAGALIGAATIVPLRRRWIEIERLPFPLGGANVPIVRVLGIPKESIAALLVAVFVAAVIEDAKQLGYLQTELPLGTWLSLPSYTSTGLEVSMLLVAAGLLTGRGGLPFLIGGAVAWWVLSPLIANFFLTPETLPQINPAFTVGGAMSYADGVAGIVLKQGLRPLGVGMFMGAALIGAIISMPVLRALLRSMRSAAQGPATELSLKAVGLVMLAGAVVLYYVAQGSLPWWQALLVVVVGLTYLVIANMVVTECEARSAQAPVSGLSFVGAILTYFLAGGNVLVAVFLAAGICCGLCTGSDSMEDLFTAFRVGANTRRAQVSQILVAWIGPIVAVLLTIVLARTVGFGDESTACTQHLPGCLPAPQATALASILDGLSKGGLPYHLYGGGAVLGALMTLLPVGGAGVLFGIAFYLPFTTTLTYGIGCFARMGINRVAPAAWVNQYLVPAASGFIIGEGLIGTLFALRTAMSAV